MNSFSFAVFCVVAFLSGSVWGFDEPPDPEIVARFEKEIAIALDADPKALLFKALRTNLEINGDRNNLVALTKLRCKATIPFLLMRMYTDATNANGSKVTQHWKLMCQLLGKTVKSPWSFAYKKKERQRRVRKEVIRLLDEWWSKEKDHLSLELGKMSDAQLSFLIHKVFTESQGADNPFGDDDLYNKNPLTASDVDTLLSRFVTRRRSSYESKWELSDLHHRMVPILLNAAGYRDAANPRTEKRASENHAGERARICYGAIQLLAMLRENGEAENLDKVVDDLAQPTATRLTCIFALYAAGEEFRSELVLEILRTEKNLERRLACIISMQMAFEKPNVVETLVKFLDDPNREIKRAAIKALDELLPLEALPKLTRIIDKVELPGDMSSLFYMLRKYHTLESVEFLIKYLKDCQSNPLKAKRVEDAIDAFAEITGTESKFRDPKPDTRIMFLQLAREIIDWWEIEGRLLYTENAKGKK